MNKTVVLLTPAQIRFLLNVAEKEAIKKHTPKVDAMINAALDALEKALPCME